MAKELTEEDLKGATDLLAAAIVSAHNKYGVKGMLAGYFKVNANIWRTNAAMFDDAALMSLLGLLGRTMRDAGIIANFARVKDLQGPDIDEDALRAGIDMIGSMLSATEGVIGTAATCKAITELFSAFLGKIGDEHPDWAEASIDAVNEALAAAGFKLIK